MGKKFIDESLVTSISNAFREVIGLTGLINPKTYPELIRTRLRPTGTLEGLENGYDVMFYDEHDSGLAFYSIKQGHQVTAPVYPCKMWVDGDSKPVSFPCIPTNDIIVYANNENYASLLYNFYGIDPVLYPHLYIIAENTTPTNKYVTLRVFFGDEAQASYSNLRYYKNSYESNGWKNTGELIENFTDVNRILELVMKYIPKSSLVKKSYNKATVDGQTYYNFYTNVDISTFDKASMTRIDT